MHDGKRVPGARRGGGLVEALRTDQRIPWCQRRTFVSVHRAAHPPHTYR